jgi:peptide deformylase
MVHEVLIWPDPRLKTKAKPVSAVDAAVRTLVDDLLETMYAQDGVGLAAPQIGVSQRIVVIDSRPQVDPDKPEKPIVLINPVLVGGAGEAIWNEGCLSVPGEFEDVERFETISVRALNRDGQPFEITDARGLLAIALQHETDHLDGTLFVDRVSTLKRELIRRRMKRLKSEMIAEGKSAKEILHERDELEDGRDSEQQSEGAL